VLIRNACDINGRPIELRFNRQIEAVAAQLEPAPGEEVIDACGGLLLPGLHDHHMHFLAYAASLDSVDCSEETLADAATLLEHLQQQLQARGGAPLRGIGYHEGEGELISRQQLDEVSRQIPIRLQHRTGRLWIYNSAAIALLQASDYPHGAERDSKGTLTGRFFHMDDWLQQHFPRSPLNLSRASQKLAEYGITGLTDAGPDNDDSTRTMLATAQAGGELLQRVVLMGRPELNFEPSTALKPGPCKIYLKENALPDFDQLCAQIGEQHQRQRAVAFHCVTAAELHYALAALDTAGTSGFDRIEHASVCDDQAIAIAAALGVTVVSQPILLAERGDRYRQSVPSDEQPLLYRARSFLTAGVPFAGSSDAPFASANPWRGMAAAIQRTTPSGVEMGSAEKLSVKEALALYLGDPADPGRRQRTLDEGQPADLVLLKESLDEFIKAENRLPTVKATWIDGRQVYVNPA
jgi:predicted amidohydrolase YtcJ